MKATAVIKLIEEMEPGDGIPEVAQEIMKSLGGGRPQGKDKFHLNGRRSDRDFEKAVKAYDRHAEKLDDNDAVWGEDNNDGLGPCYFMVVQPDRHTAIQIRFTSKDNCLFFEEV